MDIFIVRTIWQVLILSYENYTSYTQSLSTLHWLLGVLAPWFWDACRGCVWPHPLAAVCGFRLPVACRRHVFLIRHARRHHEKKTPSKTCLKSHSRTVRTQKWTMRADYWPPTEAMCMDSRHRPPFMDVVGLNPLSWMCFLLVSLEATPKKKKQLKKNRHRSALQSTFVVRVHSVLNAAPCFWDAGREHVCDLTLLAGVCGYSRHIVSLWHTFFIGHTFSSHKAALCRAETEILTRPPLKVCVFGSCSAGNAQSALVFGFPKSVCLSTHSSRLCLANGRPSGEFWHEHTYHGGYSPPK